MARSRTNEIAGVHLQDNKDPERIVAMGLKNYTTLDGDSISGWIRERIPDAVFCHRLMQVDPIDWSATKHHGRGQAHKAMAIFNRKDGAGRPILTARDFITPGNEMNLPLETGGRQASYQEIADWSWDFADEWQKLGAPCGIITPGLSPGHSEDQNDWGTPENPVIGFEILKEAWARYDLIGVHCYWSAVGHPSLTEVDGLAKFYAFRNCDTYRAYWPDKDCWIGEWNTGGWVFDSNLWQAYANECDWYLRQLATRPYIRAATHFIFDSWDQPYQISKAEPVYQRFVAIGHEYVADTGAPEPPPVVTKPPIDVAPPSGPTELVVIMDGNAATLAQAQVKYPGLQVIDSETMVVASLIEDTSAQIELVATCPSDKSVHAYPTDEGVNGKWAQHGIGVVRLTMANTSQAPRPDAVGPLSVECEGAKVKGIGMAWLTAHHHFDVVFNKRVAHIEPEPAPKPPPMSDQKLELRQYAAWADQVIHNEPVPTLNMVRDTDRFAAHLTALGVPEPSNIRRYGWPG